MEGRKALHLLPLCLRVASLSSPFIRARSFVDGGLVIDGQYFDFLLCMQSYLVRESRRPRPGGDVEEVVWVVGWGGSLLVT